MNKQEIAIGEGKREFTRIVKRISEKEEEVIITKRGKPVAAIIPYEDYKETARLRSYLKMLQISKSVEKYGLTASQIHRENRKELEGDQGRH